MNQSEIDTMIERYEGRGSAILAILQDIQAKEKYLPQKAMEYLGERLNIPVNKIYRIVLYIRVKVNACGIPHRIRLQESSYLRIVISCSVVI